MKVGDIVRIPPGQQFGRQSSKIPIVATIVTVFEWSYTGISSIEVRCKPRSRPFMVNLKHSNIEVEKP